MEERGEAEMALEEMARRYALLWLAVKVTARDENGQPTRGVLLSQHLTRVMLSHELNSIREKDICIFHAVERRRESVVMV
jgi:hypothetical protein